MRGATSATSPTSFYDQRLAMNLTLLFGCYKLHSKCEGAVHCIALVRLLVMCAVEVPP